MKKAEEVGGKTIMRRVDKDNKIIITVDPGSDGIDISIFYTIENDDTGEIEKYEFHPYLSFEEAKFIAETINDELINKK
jgi:hypothetical protein